MFLLRIVTGVKLVAALTSIWYKNLLKLAIYGQSIKVFSVNSFIIAELLFKAAKSANVMPPNYFWAAIYPSVSCCRSFVPYHMIQSVCGGKLS